MKTIDKDNNTIVTAISLVFSFALILACLLTGITYLLFPSMYN